MAVPTSQPTAASPGSGCRSTFRPPRSAVPSPMPRWSSAWCTKTADADRGRQAGRTGRAPRRGQHAAPWSNGLLARFPDLADLAGVGHGRSRLVPASCTAWTRARQGCWSWPARPRPSDSLSRAIPGAHRRPDLHGARGGDRARRLPGWSTRPSAVRPASPTRMAVRSGGRAARTTYRVLARYRGDLEASRARGEPRDGTDPPGPGPPGRHRSPGASATTATAGCRPGPPSVVARAGQAGSCSMPAGSRSTIPKAGAATWESPRCPPDFTGVLELLEQ